MRLRNRCALGAARTRLALRAPAAWPPARWATAAVAAALCALAVGLPTAVIPNPVFGRSVPVQWWNPPVLAATALLGGLLLATCLRTGASAGAGAGSAAGEDRRSARFGSASGLLAFLAVGCPVCNKPVLLLLGTSGALNIWAPVQPLLAVAALALLAVATVRRLAGEVACPVGARPLPRTAPPPSSL